MKQNFDRIQLGLNIRKERKLKNLTLEELANGIFSIGKMSNIENGVTEIQLDDVKKWREIGMRLRDVSGGMLQQADGWSDYKWFEPINYVKMYRSK